MARAFVFGIGAVVILMATSALSAETSHPRVPLVQDDTSDPDAAAILKAIKARGIQPLKIHRTYANAPKLYRRIGAVAQAIRNDAIVPRADRELIILRATQLARGTYQFNEHRAMALSCGITNQQIESLEGWRSSDLFNERQRAVLAHADAMASAEGVDDGAFAVMKTHFSVQEIVELTMTAAFYSAGSQISRTLGIQPEPDPEQPGYGSC